MTLHTRKPAGSAGSTGGQFAQMRRQESSLSLPVTATDIASLRSSLDEVERQIAELTDLRDRRQAAVFSARLRGKHPSARYVLMEAGDRHADPGVDYYWQVRAIIDPEGRMLADVFVDDTLNAGSSERTEASETLGRWDEYPHAVFDLDVLADPDRGPDRSEWTARSPVDLREGDFVMGSDTVGVVSFDEGGHPVVDGRPVNKTVFARGTDGADGLR